MCSGNYDTRLVWTLLILIKVWLSTSQRVNSPIELTSIAIDKATSPTPVTPDSPGCLQDEYGPSCNHCVQTDTCTDGHFTCDLLTGDRICLLGWTGSDCRLREQLGDDWFNLTCPENRCRNGGQCVSGRCCCMPGYTGELCQSEIIECQRGSCLNGGSCLDYVGRYECSCPVIYTGRNCETNLSIHPVVTSPVPVPLCRPGMCYNGGTCIVSGARTYCYCPTWFAGDKCETSLMSASTMQPHVCLDNYYGGNCNVHCKARDSCYWGHYVCDPATGSKVCQEGWRGDNCDSRRFAQEHDPGCHLNITCKNGGHCFKNTCCCQAPFTGEFCHIESIGCASQPCLNGGSCVASIAIPGGFICQCRSAFTGMACEHPLHATAILAGSRNKTATSVTLINITTTTTNKPTTKSNRHTTTTKIQSNTTPTLTNTPLNIATSEILLQTNTTAITPGKISSASTIRPTNTVLTVIKLLNNSSNATTTIHAFDNSSTAPTMNYSTKDITPSGSIYTGHAITRAPNISILSTVIVPSTNIASTGPRESTTNTDTTNTITSKLLLRNNITTTTIIPVITTTNRTHTPNSSTRSTTISQSNTLTSLTVAQVNTSTSFIILSPKTTTSYARPTNITESLTAPLINNTTTMSKTPSTVIPTTNISIAHNTENGTNATTTEMPPHNVSSASTTPNEQVTQPHSNRTTPLSNNVTQTRTHRTITPDSVTPAISMTSTNTTDTLTKPSDSATTTNPVHSSSGKPSITASGNSNPAVVPQSRTTTTQSSTSNTLTKIMAPHNDTLHTTITVQYINITTNVGQSIDKTVNTIPLINTTSSISPNTGSTATATTAHTSTITATAPVLVTNSSATTMTPATSNTSTMSLDGNTTAVFVTLSHNATVSNDAATTTLSKSSDITTRATAESLHTTAPQTIISKIKTPTTIKQISITHNNNTGVTVIVKRNQTSGMKTIIFIDTPLSSTPASTIETKTDHAIVDKYTTTIDNVRSTPNGINITAKTGTPATDTTTGPGSVSAPMQRGPREEPEDKTMWWVVVVGCVGGILVIVTTVLVVLKVVRVTRKSASRTLKRRPEQLTGYDHEHFSNEPDLDNRRFSLEVDTLPDSLKRDLYVVNDL